MEKNPLSGIERISFQNIDRNAVRPIKTNTNRRLVESDHPTVLHEIASKMSAQSHRNCDQERLLFIGIIEYEVSGVFPFFLFHIF